MHSISRKILVQVWKYILRSDVQNLKNATRRLEAYRKEVEHCHLHIAKDKDNIQRIESMADA